MSGPHGGYHGFCRGSPDEVAEHGVRHLMQKVSFVLGGVIHIAGTWPNEVTADIAEAWFSSVSWFIYPHVCARQVGFRPTCIRGRCTLPARRGRTPRWWHGSRPVCDRLKLRGESVGTPSLCCGVGFWPRRVPPLGASWIQSMYPPGTPNLCCVFGFRPSRGG